MIVNKVNAGFIPSTTQQRKNFGTAASVRPAAVPTQTNVQGGGLFGGILNFLGLGGSTASAHSAADTESFDDSDEFTKYREPNVSSQSAATATEDEASGLSAEEEKKLRKQFGKLGKKEQQAQLDKFNNIIALVARKNQLGQSISPREEQKYLDAVNQIGVLEDVMGAGKSGKASKKEKPKVDQPKLDKEIREVFKDANKKLKKKTRKKALSNKKSDQKAYYLKLAEKIKSKLQKKEAELEAQVKESGSEGTFKSLKLQTTVSNLRSAVGKAMELVNGPQLKDKSFSFLGKKYEAARQDFKKFDKKGKTQRAISAHQKQQEKLAEELGKLTPEQRKNLSKKDLKRMTKSFTGDAHVGKKDRKRYDQWYNGQQQVVSYKRAYADKEIEDKAKSTFNDGWRASKPEDVIKFNQIQDDVLVKHGLASKLPKKPKAPEAEPFRGAGI